MADRDSELTQRWVAPYYLHFMNGRFLRDQEKNDAVRSLLLPSLGEISDSIITELLLHRNWRHLLAGACFTGLTRRSQFFPLIGDLLLVNEKRHTSWGYCFALVRCGDTFSRQALIHYLDVFLLDYTNEQNHAYDVLGALLWLDAKQGRQDAQRYLIPWGNYATHHYLTNHELGKDVVQMQEYWTTTLTLCHRWFDAPDSRTPGITAT